VNGETLQPREQDIYDERVDMAARAMLDFVDFSYETDFAYLLDLAHNPNDPELEIAFRTAAVEAYPDYSDDSDVWHPQARGLYFGFLLGTEIGDALADRFDRLLLRNTLMDMLDAVNPSDLQDVITARAQRHAPVMRAAMETIGFVNYAEEEYERQAFSDGVCFVLATLSEVWERSRQHVDRKDLERLFGDDLQLLNDPSIVIDVSQFTNIL
jgi:hypothetical protein